MIWLTWRQFRTQSIVALAALAAAAITLGITGPHLDHLFSVEIADCIGHNGDGSCASGTLNTFTASYDFIQRLVGYALIVIPGFIGAFWGAPLLTREIESGTHQLAWNQSVTRSRWLAVKVAIVGSASAITIGLLSLMLTWWAGPLDRANANRITPAVFDQRGIDPIGWTLFAFALGLTAAVVVRRTLPAMATTLAVFTGARIIWPLYIRAHLIAPIHQNVAVGTAAYDWVGVNNGPTSPMVVHIAKPGAWILSEHTVNAAGQQVSGGTLFNLCPVAVSNGVSKRPPDSCFIQNMIRLGYNRTILTYQPANRFWPLQAVETGILVAVALALIAGCHWWVRRGKVS